MDYGGLGRCSDVPGFADRNVQGLHPVVQRCCPQLCIYVYDALQHVSNETLNSSRGVNMFSKQTTNVNEARRELFCTALNLFFSEECGGLICHGVFTCDGLFRRHRVETKLAGLYLPDAWRAKQ